MADKLVCEMVVYLVVSRVGEKAGYLEKMTVGYLAATTVKMLVESKAMQRAERRATTKALK